MTGPAEESRAVNLLPKFGRLSEIVPEDPSTWEGRIFLSLDLDWANDGVVAESIDLVERADVAATWFVTHETALLERLRDNPKFELGVHPNFNFLLDQGDPRNGGTAAEVLDRLIAIVPEAKSVRSHAVTQSSNLLRLFGERGLTHDSNIFMPEQLGIELKPWREWNDVVRAPYFWADDLWCLSPRNSGMEELGLRGGLRVFDFHPIHIFLNTEDVSRYQSARPHFADPEELRAMRNTASAGSRTMLLQLLELK